MTMWRRSKGRKGGKERGELPFFVVCFFDTRALKLDRRSGSTDLILASMATFRPNMVLMSCSVMALGAERKRE